MIGWMQIENTFEAVDGRKLSYRCWIPKIDNLKAVLVVAHGLAEHCGRYLNVVNYFVPRGYAVYGFDYQGHGRSGGKRSYIKRFSCYTRDMVAFLELVSSKHPGARLFLVGHSMGAPVAIESAIQNQEKLAGLILSGASLKYSLKGSDTLKMVVKILSALMPRMGVTVLDSSSLSTDEAVVKAYDSDPLVYRGKISARLAWEIVQAGERIALRASEIKLPVLILQGAADRMCYPEGSKAFYEQVGSADKTLKLYDGLYHEIFNEPAREQVFRDMEGWVEGHL